MALRLGRCALALALCASAAGQGPDPGSAAPNPDPEPRFEVGAEYRVRLENRFGGGENPAREDGFGFGRLRFALTARPARHARFFVEAQDARVGGLAPGRSDRGLRNPLDLRQAYASLGADEAPVTLNVGRRQLSFFNDRLIGTRGWNNTASTWDGSMLTFRRGGSQLHLLGYSLVDIQDGFDGLSTSRFIYGLAGSVDLGFAGLVAEPLVLNSRRPRVAESNQGGLLRTMGSRFAGTVAETWSYEAMLVAQRGGAPDLAQRAWMGSWSIRKAVERAPAGLELGVEWNYASGDDDPDDDVIGTFDPLYQSRHRHHGEQDLVALRNLNEFKVSAQLRPHRTVRFNFDALRLRMVSLRDGLYQLNTNIRIAPPEGGAEDGSIGSELDFVVRYTPVERVELRLGVSQFFAGDFVRRNLIGGGSQTFLNFSLTLRY